jgi:hypothetical protein
VQWVKGHFKGKKKSIENRLNEAVHDLTYSFLQKTQGSHGSMKQVIDPPSYEVSAQYDGSTITSKFTTFISDNLL